MKLTKKQWMIAIAAAVVILTIGYFASDVGQPEAGQATPFPAAEETDVPKEIPEPVQETSLPAQTPIETVAVQTPSPTPEIPAAAPAVSTETPKQKLPEIKDSVSESGIEPVKTQEPADTQEKDTRLSCTLSVNCSTILNNMDKLDLNKKSIVPQNGVILAPVKAEFYEGETVFHVLRRELKKNKIHMEFSSSPIYKTNYIEGISNLYEFDCGELSGWTYRVNGEFMKYGSSQCTLKDGDIIEWLYTCDLGRDVGNDFYEKARGK